MKRNLIVTLLLLVLNAQAAEQYFYQNAFFRTNVYLADDTNTPLHQRVPTGAVVRVRSGNVEPVEAWSFDAPITIRTNGFIITYKPDVADATNSVVVDPNGQITLRRFVSGVGWYEAVINPTNPLPVAMIPEASTTSKVSKTGDVMTGTLHGKSRRVEFSPTSTNTCAAQDAYAMFILMGDNVTVDNGGGAGSVAMAVGANVSITSRHAFVWGDYNLTSNTDRGDGSAVFHVTECGFHVIGGNIHGMLQTENTYTGGTMRLITTNGTTFRWE